jgi:hypothetical protein
MGSYLPDKVFAVCTNQLDTEYKQLTIDNELRLAPNQTVQLGSQSRVFLVKLDKKLTADFTCKSGWSSGAGTVAFGAGVLAGLAVGLAIGTVPVIGWIIGGAILIGTAAIALGAWMIAESPKCIQMIGYEESKWVMHHQTVRFDSKNVEDKSKHLALVKNSMLICKEPGGVLLPFISQSLASQAAKAIGDNNRTEMGWGIAAGVISGLMLGGGFGLPAIKAYVIWMGVGHYLVNPGARIFGGVTGKVLGNETYDTIKDNAYEDPEWWEDFGKDEGRENFSEDAKKINPNDEYNLPDDWEGVKGLTQILDLMKKNGASKDDIGKLNAAIERARANGGSLAMSKNPEMKEILIKIKAGEFGEEVRAIYKNKNGKMTGKNTKSSIDKSISSKKGNIRANNKASRIKGFKGIGGAIQIVQPFIGAFYAETAVRLAAEIFDQDTRNSIKVNAKDY